MPRPPPVTIATRPASGAPAAIDDVYTQVSRLATAVVTKTLPPGRKLQESRWDAVRQEGARQMAAVEQKGKRQAVWPGGIPKPIAPYSPAIKAGGWLFVAGQLASDFETGLAPECRLENPFFGDPLRNQSRYVLRNLAELHQSAGLDMRTDVVRIYYWYGSPIETQTDYVLTKLERIAEAAGSSLRRCVKATVYIGHPNDFCGMDRVWQRWFPNDPPARTVIPYMGLGGKGSRVEIAM